MIAQPTLKKGLTAEKCAHLQLDGGWTQIGVPTTITSDQGPQFVGQWFQTICGRLGIREAFSQAYQPQANGRAEVAWQAVDWSPTQTSWQEENQLGGSTTSGTAELA